MLEAASVVGEEFALAEVVAALEVTPDVVDRCCEGLARQRQLLVLGEPEQWPDGTFTVRARFVHALYRQAVHEQLLPTRPPIWHGRIAARKVAAYGVHTGSIAAELAVHFARAGAVGQAVQYHAEAGRFALRHQAQRVAVAQYTAGLELLARLPGTPERAGQEAELQVALGVAEMAVSGYASPEVERAYGRARVLCDQTGEAGALFPTLYGLWGFYLTRGEYRTARPLAERMLLFAERSGDAALLLQAHQALALSDYFQGEIVAAHEHLQRSLDLYDPRQHRVHLFRYGHDPAVVGLCYRGWVLWMLGYPDQALRVSSDAMVLAREIGYAPSMAMAAHGASLVHGWRGEWSEARRRSEEAVEMAIQHELPFWLGIATVGLGAIMSEQGQHEEGLTRMRAGLDACLRTGSRIGLAQKLVEIAEAHGKLGQYAQALGALAEADAFCGASGEGAFSAEAARVQGVLLLRQAPEDSPLPRSRRKPVNRAGTAEPERSREGRGGSAQLPPLHNAAEASLLRALSIAQKQGARSWELRAATSLAAQWKGQGKSPDAHRLLAGILGWFTEGAETADVRRARTLLAELG